MKRRRRPSPHPHFANACVNPELQRDVDGGEAFTAETRSGIDASARIRSGVDASASIVTSTSVRLFVERLCVRFQTARQRTSEKRFNKFHQNSSILQKIRHPFDQFVELVLSTAKVFSFGIKIYENAYKLKEI